MSDHTTIHVGERPSTLTAEATYFDGEASTPRSALLRIEESTGTLVISYGAQQVLWPLRDIRQLPDQAEKSELVLALADDQVSRLITNETSLAKRCPYLKRRNSHVKRGKIAAWAIGAVASVALIIFVLVPLMADQLADYIPPEGEKALGEATLGQIRSALDTTGLGELPTCTEFTGLEALVKISDRLEESTELSVPLTVHVLDHPMVNAFALPGGHIVFFRGLIEAAETPEELASVFAHEIGHVESRDPTRHALRSAGSIGVLGLLFGDFAGGAVVLLLTERLIEAQYSQAAEARADRFAMATMEAAGIAPGALGDMFQRLAGDHGDSEGVHSHFMSHPSLTARILESKQWQANAEAWGFEARPLLNEEEWQNLRNICD